MEGLGTSHTVHPTIQSGKKMSFQAASAYLRGLLVVNYPITQRFLGTVMGHTSPNHNSDSEYINPTVYQIGTVMKARGFVIRFPYYSLP